MVPTRPNSWKFQISSEIKTPAIHGGQGPSAPLQEFSCEKARILQTGSSSPAHCAQCAACWRCCSPLRKPLNVAKPVQHEWNFEARLRRGTFGWRGTALASERITEAVSEISKAARSDPILAAHGMVVLLSRLSSALENIDSLSGAIGSAVHRAIAKLVRTIASAPAEEPTRSAWLERLWEAFNVDDIQYIESLEHSLGELGVAPAPAAQWANRLLPIMQANFRERGSYFGETTPFLSALLRAERYGELLDLVERAPFVWWTYRRWGFHANVAQGKRADALRYAKKSSSETDNSAAAIARACGELLAQSGISEEAYRRYAVAAVTYESTYLARIRSLPKKYPTKAPATLLADLVA
jgi:hypothetical protein